MKSQHHVVFFLALNLFLCLQSCKNTSENKQTQKPVVDQDSLSGFTNKGVEIDDSLEANAVENVEKKDEDGNTLRYSQHKLDHSLEGKFEKIAANGKKMEEANYVGGKYNGNRILYYEVGDTQIVETYQLGSFEGRYKLFYPNGKLKMTGFYRNNSMNGLWYQYFETGELREEVTFKDNNENGSFKEFHKNGVVSVEGNYKNGDKEQGPLKLYNEAGELIKIMECNQGVCRTVWPSKKQKNK
jgi:antitoxin component YwqK of YwqJK toxin-antitoxin module